MVSFFNPAVLLPDASVAVRPVPSDNNASYAIGQALQQIGKVARDHYDVNALKAESNSYADFLESRSPEAAGLLRAQAENFKPGLTDTSAVRGSLFKQAIELAKLEQSDRKVENAAISNRVDNLYGVKLSAAQNDVNNTERLKIEWDTNYNNRRKSYEQQRLQAAKSGTVLPRFVEEENPYNASLARKQDEFTKRLNETPDVAPKSSSSRVTGSAAVSGSNRSGYVPAASGGGGLFPSYGGEPTADLPTGGGPSQPTLLTPPPDAQLTEYPPIVPPKAEVVTGDAALPTESPPSLTPNRTQPTTDGQPDAAEIVAAQALASRKATVGAVTSTIESAIQTLNDNRSYYLDPKSVARVEDEAKSAIAELQALPNPGSATWVQQAKIITDRVQNAIQGLPKNTVAQEDKEQALAKQEKFQVYVNGDNSKEPLTVMKREYATGIKYIMIDKNGQEKDVTKDYINGVYTKTSTTVDLKSLTDPKATIPSQIQRFIQQGK